MPSEVDIVNLALSHLGDEASVSSIDPPEASTQAQLAAQFYPVARKALLEMHPWGFSTKRTTATAMTAENDQWDYAYAVPSDCLMVFAVLPPGATDDHSAPYASWSSDSAPPFQYYSAVQTAPFAVEARTDGTLQILTDQAEADIRYIANITNTNRFTGLFTIALSRLLASYLAGPIIKGDVGRKEAIGQLQIFQAEFAKAAAADAKQGRQVVNHSVPWLAGR